MVSQNIYYKNRKKMEYLHFFGTNSEFENRYTAIYNEPWISYTEDENRVDYNKMTREMAIFRYIYCNNVTEEDKNYLKNASMLVYVWTDNTPSVSIEFDSGNMAINQLVSISQELATQLKAIEQQDPVGSKDKILDMVLPMFKCVGNLDHHWQYNGVT